MIVIDRTLKKPLYEQVYDRIRADILSGRMEEGQALVPIRVLAQTLGVSKNTIDMAYKQLLAEGYVRARRGSGYYVENTGKYGFGAYGDKAARGHGGGAARESKLSYDFSFESVSSAEFEWRKWKKCIDESLYEEEYNFNGYRDCRGDAGLRRSVAKYIFDTRDVRCGIGQVVICSGTLYAVNMAVNVISKYTKAVEPSGRDRGGGRFASCDPACEGHVKNVFISKGYGICGQEDARDKDILYVSPSHQYPLGQTMDYGDRLKHIDYAEKHGAFIIENDCDSEFSYGGPKIPSMQSMCGGRVIYVSSVSRILSPNVRLAYMVLPERLTDIFMELYDGYRTAVPVLHQRTLARYIDAGYMHKHIRRLLRANEEKYEVISECLGRLESEGFISVAGKPAGGYVAIRPAGSGTGAGLAAYAREYGIGLYEEGGYVLIGWLSIAREDIDDAAGKLYGVVREYFERN